MNYKTISSYLSARIKTIDPEFSEHLDAFNEENISSSKINKVFFISPPSMVGSYINQNLTSDIINFHVSLYFKGFRDPRQAIDLGFDIANKFRLTCMNPVNLATLAGTYPQTKVLKSNITCEPFDTNDNIVKYKLDFEMKTFYGTRDNFTN